MTSNLSRILRWNRYRHEHDLALVFEDRTWTFGRLDDEVSALAAGLSDAGLGRGDLVAILSLNSPEYLVTTLAVARLGAVFLPLNHRLHVNELKYIVDHSGPTTIFAEPEFHTAVDAVRSQVPAVSRVVTYGPEPPPGWSTYVDLIMVGEGAEVADADLSDDDLQRILYTSGTTSLPKGAMITHGNCNANMDAQVVELGLTRGQSVLVFGPLYHVGGLDVPGYSTWYVGATMVLMRRFDPTSILEAVMRHGIVGMAMVATMVHQIRQLPERLDFDTSSVRWLIFGQVHESLFRDTLEVFPRARLIESYGLTETCNGLSYLDEAHMFTKPGSVGRPMQRVDMRVVDENDAAVPAGVPGEIVVRGPTVSPGYWRDLELTQSTHRKGWFHTGDIGRFDADGYLYIVDRKKDIIRSGGENVASSEIEHVIYQHPAVSEVAVVGVPDERWLEVPKAFVVLLDGAVCTSDELRGYCLEHLAKFKVPRGIIFVEELPRNPSGKVLKRELRERVD